MNSLDPLKIHRLINVGFALAFVVLIAVVGLSSLGSSNPAGDDGQSPSSTAQARQEEDDDPYAGLPHLTLTAKKMKLTTGRAGDFYNTVLRTVNDTGPFKWQTISGKWPKGMRLDAQGGNVWGRPDDAGKYELRIRVTDSTGASSEYDLTLVIRPPRDW